MPAYAQGQRKFIKNIIYTQIRTQKDTIERNVNDRRMVFSYLVINMYIKRVEKFTETRMSWSFKKILIIW